MRNLISIRLKGKDTYCKFSRVGRIIDGFKTKCTSQELIKEVGAQIKYIDIPANINDEAYKYNIIRASKRYSTKNSILCPCGIRIYDYQFLSDFQKRMFAFSVVESMRIVLLKSGKSLKKAEILVDDGCKNENKFIIEELAKEARNIVILTKDITKSEKLREFIIYNYGATLEILYREDDIGEVDFIISSEQKEYNCQRVWYLNNLYSPNKQGLFINETAFKIPWDSKIKLISPELLGGIIKDVKKIEIKDLIRKNNIILEEISFNSKDIVI
ncbi:hypothetical protein [Clostridium vincentii]|uniref:Uncharacterized protein n=1 Tax=Clostridium vincentii TaxID=52704 RepID=A0A2T0B8A7_9CLOT|nr:hypothetical protein [Clostridium vincentii]PRR80047.1 hypothetical protein CLVI_31270 [Clostridium vincentii]